jgi:hypothetical protein
MKKRRRDVFGDEPTTPYEPGNVPVVVEDEDTRPVDAEELAVAARRSREVREPHDPTSVAAVRTSPNARPRPFAEVQVAGAGAFKLPVHRISMTGMVLTVPTGFAIDLASDTPVTVVVHLMPVPEQVTRARLPANVAHLRSPRGTTPGGLSLRWDLRDPGTRRAVEALLAEQA